MFLLQVNTAKAEAELAYSLQAAKVQAKIKEEEMQVKVVERQQEIKIMEQEITRKERELDSAVKKPAEAEKFRLEKIAEADKIKKVLQAEADAEALAQLHSAVQLQQEGQLQPHQYLDNPSTGLWSHTLPLAIHQ